MVNNKNFLFENDDSFDNFSFKDDDLESVDKSNQKWVIMIVDDEPDVHTITKAVLKYFSFEGKELTIISAYSVAEAKKLIKENPDIALIFLDVIMESDHAGLDLIKYIRDELKNMMCRIVIRTGQPGEAPEETTIIEYDINDYKEKTELTAKKLFTCVISALRSYRDLMILDSSRKALEKIVESSNAFFKSRNIDNFTEKILQQIELIFSYDISATQKTFSGVVAKYDQNKYNVINGNGEYENKENKSLFEIIPNELIPLIKECGEQKEFDFYYNYFIAHIKSLNNLEYIIIVKKNVALNDWDKDLLSIYFTNITIAFDNIYLNEEIESTQKEIIYTLGEIAEARSKETSNHVRRVAEFSRIIATKYGLSDEDVNLLRKASPMHDIGKIAIPDNILNKPAKLTQQEYEIMKTHALVGYEMLKKSNRQIMKAAAQIALELHEKYDGTGYPNKLKGEEISIFARITAVADVFDALRCDRVYKTAWPIEKIVELFKEQKGKHFESQLVDILLDNLDEFMEIIDMYPDVVKNLV